MEVKESKDLEDITLLSSDEAASYLKISKPQLYQLKAQGKLPVKYVGSKPVYVKQELYEWVMTGKTSEKSNNC